MSENDGASDYATINQDALIGANVIRNNSFSEKIIRAINIITDLQAYAPSYITAALGTVLQLLHAVVPLSPPPERTEQTAEANANRNNVNRENLEKIAAQIPQTNPVRRSIAVQPEPDLLGNILSTGKDGVSKIDITLAMVTSSKGTVDRTSIESRENDLPATEPGPSLLPQRLSIPNVKTTNIFGWNFDIFQMEHITSNRPLVSLGMQILTDFNVQSIFKVSSQVLGNWLLLMEANYHHYNPYHNATHAADVLQAAAYFMKTERLSKYLDPLDQALCLIAAVVHDLDHPGKTNSFLLVTRHELALLYNDKAILESHHAAFAFKITLSDPRVNIFENLDTSTYRHVRSGIVDTVLATEMVHHYQHVTAFTAALKTAFPSVGAASKVGNGETDPFKTDPNVILTRRMLIKCSDVSNPARPLRLTCEWALRICEEFFIETEEEAKLGVQLTLPYFIRETCSVPAAQTGFNDFFTLNLFTPWHEFIQVHEVMKSLRENDAFWRRLIAEGITTAAQVKVYFHTNRPGDDPVL